MSDVNSGPDATDSNDKTVTDTVTADKANDAPDAHTDANNDKSADMFPRSYVEELRKESADYRLKAKDAETRADELAKRLHAELVKATGRLENHADLPYDVKHLDDAEALTAALDALLADRPYLGKRVVRGDVGQGERGGADAPVSLLGLLQGKPH